MGQPIKVTLQPGLAQDVRFFATNRSLTGMEIERYDSLESAAGSRPVDVLARRLIKKGAEKVTMYSNVVTIEAPTERWSTLESAAQSDIAHLFEYYGDEAGWSDAALATEGVTFTRAEPSE